MDIAAIYVVLEVVPPRHGGLRHSLQGCQPVLSEAEQCPFLSLLAQVVLFLVWANANELNLFLNK